MIHGTEDRYSFAYRLFGKKFVRVNNYLCGFTETVAPLQDSVSAECTRLAVEFVHWETCGFISPKSWLPNSTNLKSWP